MDDGVQCIQTQRQLCTYGLNGQERPLTLLHERGVNWKNWNAFPLSSRLVLTNKESYRRPIQIALVFGDLLTDYHVTLHFRLALVSATSRHFVLHQVTSGSSTVESSTASQCSTSAANRAR